MTNSQKDDIISKEIIIALRKKGGSDTKRAIVEYFRKNSEIVTEEYIDFRRINKKYLILKNGTILAINNRYNIALILTIINIYLLISSNSFLILSFLSFSLTLV